MVGVSPPRPGGADRRVHGADGGCPCGLPDSGSCGIGIDPGGILGAVGLFPKEDSITEAHRIHLAFAAACVVSLVLLEGYAALVMVAFWASWWRFLYRSSVGRIGNPFSLAFTSTVVAALLIFAGIVGYSVGRGAPLADSRAWSGSVIWWEVGLGLALLTVAIFFWRLAFRLVGSGSTNRTSRI